MGIRYEWGTTGEDVGVSPAGDYEDAGLYVEVDPDVDTYAMVIGGDSGGGFVVEGTADGMYHFAERVMRNAFGALQLETLLSRTAVAEWVGRPLGSNDVVRLGAWLERNLSAQVRNLVAAWDAAAGTPGEETDGAASDLETVQAEVRALVREILYGDARGQRRTVAAGADLAKKVERLDEIRAADPVPTPDELADLSHRRITPDATDHVPVFFAAPASKFCTICGFAGALQHIRPS